MFIKPGNFPEVFDSSILNDFKECPTKFYNSSVELWKGKGRSVHLHAGGAFAHGIEAARRAFYEGKYQSPVKEFCNGVETQKLVWVPCPLYDSETSVAIGLQALLSFYGDFAYPEDSAKTPERMAGALEYYFEHYPLLQGESDPVTLPGGKLGIEFGFVEPLEVLHPVTDQPILYSGRMDAILKTLGCTLLTDEKTASSLGATWSRQWDLRGQFTGYAWGCGKNGVKVDGALIRGVSILKTKYETQQAVTYRPQWQIDRWFTEVNEYIADAIMQWKRKYFRHNLGEACSSYGGCAFKQTCQTQEPQSWFETYFERRHWDPVLRTETLIVEEAQTTQATETSLPSPAI